MKGNETVTSRSMHGRENSGVQKTEEVKPLGRHRPAWEDILMYGLFNDASNN